MKLKREEFLGILKAVRPGLAKKEIIDRSTNFIFSGKSVLTYNDLICISHPLKTDFHCAVPAADFYKIVSGMEGDEIDLSCKEGKILLNGKKSRSGHASVSELGGLEDLIKALRLESSGRKWVSLPDDFIEGLKLCMFSVSQDATQIALSCVSVNNSTIVSSDNNRISYYEMKKGLKAEFLIRGSSVVELVNFPVVEFCLSDAWIYFRTKENVIFASRRNEGEFPDVSSFLELKGQKITFPKELRGLVQDVTVMAPGEFEIDKKISLRVEKGRIICRGEKEQGWMEKDLDFEGYTGKGVEFQVNPIFFEQVLGKSTSVVLGDGRALFTSGKFRHLMCLPVE